MFWVPFESYSFEAAWWAVDQCPRRDAVLGRPRGQWVGTWEGRWRDMGYTQVEARVGVVGGRRQEATRRCGQLASRELTGSHRLVWSGETEAVRTSSRLR